MRCPVHEAEGDHKPSLAIWQNGTTIRYKCMTGCPKALVTAALKKRSIEGLSYGGAVSIEAQLLAKRQRQQRRVDGMTEARDILLTGVDITAETPSFKYLARRALACRLEDEAYSLRDTDDPLHPGERAFAGTLVDLRSMRSPQIKATGIQTLSLFKDGTPMEAKGHKLRSIRGELTGSAVPLGDFSFGNHLVLAEGIESALAARRLFHANCCAAVLSAGNYGSLLVPEWINKVTIAADNDDAGIDGARRLQRQLQPLGIAVIIMQWGASGSGWDAADEWSTY